MVRHSFLGPGLTLLVIKGGNKNCERIKGYGKSLQECDLLILFVLNIRIQERSEGRTKEGL